MNYELAKRLKDAGFPQKEWDNDEDYNISIEIPNSLERVYCPALEELIKECGDEYNKGFGMLIRNYTNWTASGGKDQGIDEIAYDFNADGNEPDEAVAELWLKLRENGNLNN